MFSRHCSFEKLENHHYLGAKGTFTSYNLFAYCENNPVNNIDSNGTFVLTLTAISISTVALIKILLVVALTVIVIALLSNPAIQRQMDDLVDELGSIAKELAQLLVRAILEAVRKAITRKKDNRYEIHHIVAQSAKGAAPARNVLGSVGWTTEIPSNKVKIKYNLHRHLHTTAYYKAVMMEPAMKSKTKIIAVLTFIGAQLCVANSMIP